MYIYIYIHMYTYRYVCISIHIYRYHVHRCGKGGGGNPRRISKNPKYSCDIQALRIEDPFRRDAAVGAAVEMCIRKYKRI